MEDPIWATSMSKKMEKESRIQLGLPDLEVLRAQIAYDQVLRDMKKYAKGQEEKEISPQERETEPREWF